jgi:pimeloyl-ACP methyl ester carboxylesterase
MAQLLHYQQEGSGDTIVLLHGFLASSQYFKQLRKRLARTHTVISIDLLGFGKSPKPAASDYSYEAHVAAVHATLARIGTSKFVLVGHSLGALIALRYANTYPEQVRRLGLLNPPMYKTAAQALETLQGTGLHYRTLLHSPYQDLVWYIAKVLPRFPFNRRRPPINLSDVLRVTVQARTRTYEQVILQGKFFADTAQLRVPGLLVVGRHDRQRYHENSQNWQVPPMLNAMTVNSGHHLPVRQPEVVEQIIRSHLLR